MNVWVKDRTVCCTHGCGIAGPLDGRVAFFFAIIMSGGLMAAFIVVMMQFIGQAERRAFM